MKYTFECCNYCNKAEKCRKSFPKQVKCLQNYNKYWKEQEEATDEFIEEVFANPELYRYDDAARFILEEYADDDECREIFDRNRCKGCNRYDECFYAECASEVYWEDQQHPVIESIDVEPETWEINSDEEIPF